MTREVRYIEAAGRFLRIETEWGDDGKVVRTRLSFLEEVEHIELDATEAPELEAAVCPRDTKGNA